MTLNESINNWKEDVQSFISNHKIPDTEELLLRQANEEHEVLFFVTYNKRVNEYYLYKVKNGKSKKTKTSDSPEFKELEAKK